MANFDWLLESLRDELTSLTTMNLAEQIDGLRDIMARIVFTIEDES